MKPKTSTTKNFERSKLLLFKFLAHQIHPFAYAVNTFLQPSLDDCRLSLQTNPQETFNMLLSLAQTFLRFAPDSQLIYEDIKQFANKLKDSIDECFIWLDPDATKQSSELIESVRHNLLKIIEQENNGNHLYTNMYKNMSKFTNLDKLNSLPTELQMVSSHDSCDTTISIDMPVNKSIDEIAKVPSMLTIASSMGTSVTTKLMNQMKNLTVSSVLDNPVRPPSTTSYLSDYEIADTLIPSNKKQPASIATFPPRDSVLFNDDDALHFGTTPTLSEKCSSHGDDIDTEKGAQYYLNPFFTDPMIACSHWQPIKPHLSIVLEQSYMNNTKTVNPSHVTENYIREFGNQQIRPILRGDLCMTYGKPQNGPQSSCLPIGVGLSYDESILLSCDVHRSAQCVRLFDVESGQLKHTITSNQQMKFHRPSAVMSNARNNILIVERDYIYVTTPEGRLVQKIGHSSVKQLYGIALFHDRYLLTIDSKSTESNAIENSRLLLFDPNTGQLVFEQPMKINKETEEDLQQYNIKYIRGKILPEATTKPRFLAVQNNNIYIADLGRSLIYGTTIHNGFSYNCHTVFGGHGRAHGEMMDPSGLFLDSTGNIISADSKNDRIQIFRPDGEFKTTLKLNERIKRPSGICTNRNGTTFYVSCYLAGCVRAFNISY